MSRTWLKLIRSALRFEQNPDTNNEDAGILTVWDNSATRRKEVHGDNEPFHEQFTSGSRMSADNLLVNMSTIRACYEFESKVFLGYCQDWLSRISSNYAAHTKKGKKNLDWIWSDVHRKSSRNIGSSMVRLRKSSIIGSGAGIHVSKILKRKRSAPN